MKKTILALAIVLFSDNAPAEWTRVGGGENRSDIYVDLETIRRDGHKIKLWSMQNFKTPNGTTKQKYLSSKLWWEFDCKETLARIPSVTTYSGKKGSGSPIDNHYNVDDPWQPFPPDTVGEIIFNVACYSPSVPYKWVFVRGSLGRDSTTDLYLEPSTIQRMQDTATMWVLFDTRGGDHAPSDKSYSVQLYQEYDCKEQRSRDLRSLNFFANMGVGKSQINFDPTPWRPISEGTLSNALWRLACDS
jgi:hypothetical protein